MYKITIGNTCTHCGLCPLVTKGAIDFSDVAVDVLRDALFMAEKDRRQRNDPTPSEETVRNQLSKIKINSDGIKLEHLKTLKENCYVGAFDYTDLLSHCK